jgi:hypothetical protein
MRESKEEDREEEEESCKRLRDLIQKKKREYNPIGFAGIVHIYYPSSISFPIP